MIASSFSKHFILSGILVVSFVASSTAFASEPTCLSGGTKPAKIRAGAAGFQDEDITVIEGVSGPEVRIGQTVLFLDPNGREDEQSSGEPTRNNNWCVVDPDLARQNNESNPKNPNCYNPFGQEKNGQYDKPLVIKGANGRPVAKITAKERKDQNGKKMIELIFQGLNGHHENKMVISGHATGKDKQSKVQLRVESKNFRDEKTNGVLESTVEGTLAESSPNDPRSGTKFASCRSAGQTQGQLRKKEDKAPENWVDLSGSHITMRGNERYGIDRYNPTEDSVAQRPQFMVDNAGRN